MIINRLRHTLLALLCAVLPHAAQADNLDNLPVRLVPNLVELSGDTRGTFIASAARLIVTDHAGMYGWDIATKRLVLRIVYDAFAKSHALTPAEDMMISGHMDGKIRLWALATGAPAGVLTEKAPREDSIEVTALAVKADGTELVSGTDNGLISVWSLKTQQKLRSFNFGELPDDSGARIVALRLTADQKTLIALTRTWVKTFDVATGRPLTVTGFPNDKQFRYEFSGDSIVGEDGLVAQVTPADCDFAELRYVDRQDFTRAVALDKPANCKRRDEDSDDLGEPSLFVNAAGSAMLVTRAGSAEIREWNFKTRAVTRTIKWPDNTKPAAIGVDKTFARVARNVDDHVSVRELETGAAVAAFDSTNYPANTIRSKDGKTILLAQTAPDKKHQQLTLWDAGAAEPKKVLQIAADDDTVVRDFSPEAGLVATVAKDSFLLYSLDSGQDVRLLKVPAIKTPWIIRLSPDGKLALLLGNGENNASIALLVDTADGRVRTNFDEARNGKAEDDYANSLADGAFSADGKRLALGRFNGTAEVWDVASLKRIRQLPSGKDDPGQIRSFSFSADGKKLLACSRDGGAYLWTLEPGNEASMPPRAFLYDDYAAGHAHLGGAALAHDGSMVAAGSAQHAVSSGDSGYERSVKIWNAATGKLRRSWLGHELAVNTVTFSADDRMLVSASRDGTIKYWDAATTKEVASIIVGNDGHWVVVSPSGLFAGDGGETSLLNFARGAAARPASDFKAQLYKPDLIAELLKGDPNHRYATAAKQIDLKKIWDGTAP